MSPKNRTSYLAMLALAAVTLASPPAFADETHDIAVAPKSVSVTVKGGWHVNKEYPWKLVSGDKKLDKTHFVLGETTASIVDAPPGPAKIKGAVCSGDQCRTFEEDVIVP
jgi:hypothetical protein